MRTRPPTLASPLGGALFLLLFGSSCAEYGLEAGDYESARSDSGYASAGAVESDADADTDDDDDGEAPPEDEDDYLRMAPAATDKYVFVANPGRDTVTRIAVSDLAVQTVEVGHIPSTVFTTGDFAQAVTLNEGDDSVSIVTAETMVVEDLAIRDNMNSLSLSGDGEWAMAWYDPDKDSMGTSNGVLSFNEVSLVRMEPPTHHPLAVGYNPQGVRWSDDGKLAVVVSDGSLAVIDLTVDPPSTRTIAIAEDELDAPPAEEVVLSPDGKYAFVRQGGTEFLLVIDLAAGTVSEVDVGEDPTDMDVTPDGQRLAVVARTAREIWAYDVDDPFATPTLVAFPSDSAYGAVAFAGDGTRAILYTNALRLDTLAIWDTETDSFDERSLIKPVQSIGLSPAGDNAIIFHTKEDADDADDDNPFNGEWAATLMETDGAGENKLLLPAEPSGYGVTDDSAFGFFIMKGEETLEVVSFSTLLPTLVSLPSEPVFVGALPDSPFIYASQQHELGRISFYEAANAELDTITGFELNADIEH